MHPVPLKVQFQTLSKYVTMQVYERVEGAGSNKFQLKKVLNDFLRGQKVSKRRQVFPSPPNHTMNGPSPPTPPQKKTHPTPPLPLYPTPPHMPITSPTYRPLHNPCPETNLALHAPVMHPHTRPEQVRVCTCNCTGHAHLSSSKLVSFPDLRLAFQAPTIAGDATSSV